MKKKRLSGILALVLVLSMVFVLSACGESTSESGSSSEASSSSSSSSSSSGSSSSDKVYDLSFSMHDGAATLKYQYTEEWANELNEATDGALNIEIYAGGALASQETVVEAINTGACDIGMVYTASYDDIFPLTNGVSLPMLGIQTAEEATEVLWDMYEQSPEMQEEYDGYVLLQLYSNGTSYPLFKDKAVNTFEGFSGLKIRTAGGSTTEFLTQCGAVPMTISTSDLYESLEKGVVDGNIGSGSQVASWNLAEVDHYFLDMPVFCGVWMTLMNKNTYDSLPEEIQDALMETSGREYSLKLASYLQGENDDAFEAAVDEGCEWVEISDEEVQKFYDAALVYNDSWIESRSTDTFDAQNFYDMLLESVAEHTG